MSHNVIDIGSSDEEENGRGSSSATIHRTTTVSMSITKETPLDLNKFIGNKQIVKNGAHANRQSMMVASAKVVHRQPPPAGQHSSTLVSGMNGVKRTSQGVPNLQLYDQHLEVAKIVSQSTEIVEKRRRIQANEYHKNVPTTSRNDHQLNRFKQFSNTYKIANDTKRVGGGAVTEEDFLGQLECSYQNCGKCLKNNVSLMWHVWAHVVQQKPTEAEEITNLQIWEAERRNSQQQQSQMALEEEEKTDVTRLHTCPECLLVQPNPHRIQLHYHRVHKRDGNLMTNSLFTCNICEQVIGAKEMTKHIQSHQLWVQKEGGRGGTTTTTLDLPYSCRYNSGTKKCRFRASTRTAVIDHFSASHKGTFVMLCPFCLLTFSVPAVDRKNNRVKVKDYMRHVLQHDIEKTLFCGQCAIRFPNTHEQQLRNHIQQQHTHGAERKWAQWQHSTRALDDIKQSRSVPVSADLISQRCLECKLELSTFQDHYGMNNSKCAHCDYSTCCKTAFAAHQTLSKCNPANAVRWLLGRMPEERAAAMPASPPPPPAPTLRCSKCEFRTLLLQNMAEHLFACDGSEKIVMVEDIMATTNECDEGKEARIFGLGAMERQEKEEEKGGKETMLEDGEEDEEEREAAKMKEWLNEFLPPNRLAEMMEHTLALKHMASPDGEECGKTGASALGALRKTFGLALNESSSGLAMKKDGYDQ